MDSTHVPQHASDLLTTPTPRPPSEDDVIVTLRFPGAFGQANMWPHARAGEGQSFPHAAHMQSFSSTPGYHMGQYPALNQPPLHFHEAHASPPNYPYLTVASQPNLHFTGHPSTQHFATPTRYPLPHAVAPTFFPGVSISRSPEPVGHPDSESNNITVSRNTAPSQQTPNEPTLTGAMQEPAQTHVQSPPPARAQPAMNSAEQSSGVSRAAQAGASPGSAPVDAEPHVNALEAQPASAPSKTTVAQTPVQERYIEDNMTNLQPGLYGRKRNPRRPATKLYREAQSPNSKRGHQASNAIVATPNKKLKRSPTAEEKARTSSLRSATIDSSSNAAPTAVEEVPTAPTPESSSNAAPAAVQEVPPAIEPTIEPAQPTPTPTAPIKPRPERDEAGDREFVKKVMLALEPQTKRKTPDMGKRQANRISSLLEKAEYPDESEAQFLTTDEAMEAVSTSKFFNGIIVTTGQQTLPLQGVEQFLDEYYEDNADVWIQDPAVRPTKNTPITRKVKMKSIKQRFAKGQTTQPWNLLELATHCDDGLRPLFLNTEDCRLLTKVKIPGASDHARRRTYEAGYKEVEKWALLAQAGALTEPHQDSHGYSTFITINTGLVGFGWLALPTEQERADWRADPINYLGGNWRYVVLKPGQTVYFPAGTVHFVFRLAAEGDTLAFGGHILRCSNLVHWVKTLIEERDQKDVTNEDLTDSATGYLDRVEKFVKQAIGNRQADKWGGEQAIEEFLRLKEDFSKIKQR